MLYLLIYSIVAFKLTDIIVYEDIFTPIRDRLRDKPFLFDMISCHNCISVWIGFLFSIILILCKEPSPIGLVVSLPVVLDVIASGLFTGGVVSLLFLLKYFKN